MDIKKRVQQEVPEIIHNMTRLVSHPSFNTEALPGMPFGKANAEVLADALDILNGYGFRTVNLDNYAGYAEIGQGEKVIGMVGHLDVVPVSNEWSTNPFQLVEKDGNLYGRGATDDKGPVCCAIAALRIVNELRPNLNKRIRMVMGCNEESGSAGLRHYVKQEGDFDLGFTPDANFPLIMGEKGMCFGRFETTSEKIVDVEGGEASNVVCGKVTFKIKKGTFDTGKLAIALHARNIKYELNELDPMILTVYGVKAHASMPDLGVNAISEAFAALEEAGLDDPAVRFYNRYFGLTCHGERMGIDQHDAYGDLTMNIGVISEKNHVITGTIDIRYPVTQKPDVIKRMLEKAVHDDEDGKVIVEEAHDPLFFPPDSPLVSSLMDAYQKVTGDTQHGPMVIGGGTYAKDIGNTVGFGPEFPDGPDIHMHGDDEFIQIKDLPIITEVYVQALLNLLDVD